MEAALSVFARKAGFDVHSSSADWPRKDEVPFDTQNRFMATLNHDHHGHSVIYLKGAPERILDMCSGEVTESGEVSGLNPVWGGGVGARSYKLLPHSPTRNGHDR